MKNIARYFFQGLLLIVPTALTFYIIYAIFNFIDKFIQDFFREYLPIEIPGLGVIVLLLGITFLGFIGKSIIFKPFKLFFEYFMSRTPVVRELYSAIKDLLSAFVGNDKKFNKPVLVKLNLNSDLEKMGFITHEDLSSLGMKDKVTVYFPHSYNFSGEMFIVPRDQVKPLDLPSSEVMKYIVSGGVTKV